jgi:regulator of nonsense transcripts 3
VYFHVTKQDYVTMLGDRIRDSPFHDAAKSWQDSALVGAPTLEFAPYPKMPGGRRRNDNRQGTIDQDQEFKDFLESLTNPIAKSAAPDGDAQKQDKVKTTPLIEALREKKANKDKPNTKASRNARGENKEDAAEKKTTGKQGKENALNTGDKNRRITKADKAQAAKEAVKILNKEASSSKDSSATADKNTASPAPERKRGNVAGVKSLLQRDLGIGAAPNRRRGTKREVMTAASDAAAPTKENLAPAQKTKDVPVVAGPSSEKAAQPSKKERPTRAERRAFKASLVDKTNDKAAATDAQTQAPTKSAAAPAPQILKKPQTVQAPVPPKGPAASRAPPTEPAAARNVASPAQKNTAQSKPNAPPAVVNPAPRAAPALPKPDPTSKQAFLKHANPSQGITEPLIEESLKVFGGIEKVEIDKRKGFAYVDFTEPEGLQKAMAASPIKIAQGAVQVLERKEKVARPALNPRFNGPPPTGPARGGRGGFGPRGRGGRGGARGGGHMVSNPSAATTEPGASAPPTASPAPTPVASTATAT